ncbi:hypothetical protein [Sphingomonas sp.]|uniref:hypothetical protein n=1 Tax=Sphingomonas sp. TaxID=28214 RepID=UPI002ED798AD
MAMVGTAGLALAQSTPAGKGRPADPNRKICKSEKATGSRVVKRKICLTSAEWDRAREQAGTELRQQKPMYRCETAPTGGVTC